jgi:calcium-dependent protein kinase
LEKDYEVETKVLGRGYNGEVFMATSKEDKSKKFAVKGFKLIGMAREVKGDLENEAEVFLNMDHPHVVRLVDCYETPERLTMVMECLEGGELFHRIQKRRKFQERDAAAAIHQMLLALNYIHSHGVVHRDIKLENFLYVSQESDELKLIDFGFSKFWEPTTKLKLSCGTLAYVAPEVLGKSYDLKCDMWSCGICSFILLLGYMPFQGSEDTQKQSIKAGKFLIKEKYWSKLTPGAQDFLRRLIVVDPQMRLDATSALAHPWLQVRAKPPSHHHDEVSLEIATSLANFGQASVVRRACMTMMAWSLTAEDRDEVQAEFEALDTDKSGTISTAEFLRVLEDKYHIDDHTAREAFRALDMTHDDEIHYSEFLAATVSARINLHDHLMHDTFKRFDADGNGVIELSDLKEVLGDCFDGTKVEVLIKDMDKNADGKIDYPEFIAYLRAAEDSSHAEAAHQFIDHLADKHGTQSERVMRKKTESGFSDDGAAGGCGCCSQ